LLAQLLGTYIADPKPIDDAFMVMLVACGAIVLGLISIPIPP
jgi:hypothetical protein